MHDFNRPTWSQNYACPLGRKEFAEWQQRLDALAGKEDDGTSRLQLFWGMDMSPEHREWNRFQREWQPPFVSRKVINWVKNPDTGIDEPEIGYIGVPRFFVRMLDVSRVRSPNNAPGVEMTDVAEEMRSSKGFEGVRVHQETTGYTEARFRRPPYLNKLEWSLHDYPSELTGLRKCCEEHRRAERSGKCYGEYLPPDERMITRLAAEMHEARALTESGSDAYKLWLAMEFKHKTAVQRQLAESHRDFARTLRRMGNPCVFLHG